MRVANRDRLQTPSPLDELPDGRVVVDLVVDAATSWERRERRRRHANGENTNDGTRKPAWLWSKSNSGSSSGSCGGGTWSKKPPHSSYVTINAVFDHSGDVAIAFAINDTNAWPR